MYFSITFLMVNLNELWRLISIGSAQYAFLFRCLTAQISFVFGCNWWRFCFWGNRSRISKYSYSSMAHCLADCWGCSVNFESAGSQTVAFDLGMDSVAACRGSAVFWCSWSIFRTFWHWIPYSSAPMYSLEALFVQLAWRLSAEEVWRWLDGLEILC